MQTRALALKIDEVAPQTGFEPAAFRSGGERSIP